MKTVTVLVALVTAVASLTAVASPWSAAGKQKYVERCIGQMEPQLKGMGDAGVFCKCAANGMEKTFGTERYEEMMQATPNPNGSSADQQLYEIMARCADKSRTNK
ncbi:hypothetical protein HLV40_07250 [Chromohalobacter salexigens]|nr:hypothetical protein [Chromohalobacter salexigens]